MRPLAVPTITSRKREHLKYDVALVSPRRDRPLFLGLSQTIVDCATFSLRRDKSRQRVAKALAHYKWYVEFVRAHADRSGMVFVAPDLDWLRGRGSEIEAMWAEVQAPALAMPGQSTYALTRNLVGHCLRSTVNGPVHPEWTHTFSVPKFEALDGKTNRWTFDTTQQID